MSTVWEVGVIRVIVKGDEQVASAAAKAHKVSFEVARPIVGANVDHDLTVLHVPDSCLDKVVRWFSKPGKLVPGRGYPVGTCLVYSKMPKGGKD